MLLELHLQNLGVISHAQVELGPGLNVVTGETGVGKTLLITSLALLTGGRGQARLVSHGSDEAVVQAVLSANDAMNDALTERGLETSDDELIVSRRLGSDGRSRAWVGGQLVPVGTLSELGEALVEMHGQGSGFALARSAAQLAALDALGHNAELLASYRAALQLLRELEREHARLEEQDSSKARELDFLTFQADEIERARLACGEEEQLGIDLARLEHAEDLAVIGADALDAVGGEGAAGALATAHKSLLDAASIDASVEQVVARVGDLAAEAAELAREIRAWAEGLEADPGQLEALRERRALIGSLKRKYGATVEAVLATATQARERIEELRDAEARISTIDADIARATDDVTTLAKELTKRRTKAAKSLTKLVSGELPALALPLAVFEVTCSTGEFTDSGADRVEFLFSSSRGRPREPIGKVASGGELSRAMIAVTLALAQTHAVPVLVFDEADQGVGGEAALELARRLQLLGTTHQVLVVSHLPQIAAFADRHIVVRRSEEVVEIQVLDEDERPQEISRMLAGLGSSELARAHAAELLELARSASAATAARAG